ncbi:MAG: hypothetical protein ACKVVT_00825 [Dehalococcoidia bacterium]
MAKRHPAAPGRPTGPAPHVTAQRRRPTVVPDLLFALAVAAWTMAGTFIVLSFVAEDVVAGEAGATLARVFAVMLAISGLLLAIIGILLLRDERRHADHFTALVIIGLLMGGAATALFLLEQGDRIWAPSVLLLFVFRPIRRLLTRPFRRGPQ